MLVLLSSRHRHNADSNPCSFQCKLNAVVDTNRIAALSIKRVTVPNLFPNVSGRRAILHYESGGVRGAVSIPAGYYQDAAVLFTAVRDALNAVLGAGAVTALSLDPFAYRVAFDCTVPLRILSHTEIESASSGYSNTQSLNEVLGAAYVTSDPESLSFRLPGVINLSGVQNVLVCSSTISMGRTVVSDGRAADALVSVPVDVPFGSTIQWEASDESIAKVALPSTHPLLSSTDIQLRDADGELLELPPNVHVDVLLGLTFRSHDDF